jgi:uncharacterized protein
MNHLFNLDPLVIAALHLPSFDGGAKARPMAWYEDYVLRNMAVFAEGGIPAVYLQDGTPTTGRASAKATAALAALGRMAQREFPRVHLGIIMRAHDPVAPLAVAHASGASFVRIKVYVGAMLKAEGIQQGCGMEAASYRQALGREDISILADVHDRMGSPLLEMPIEEAAGWAVRSAADGLILTGSTYEQSLEYLRNVRQSGVQRPLLLGGSANENNIAEVLQFADGVIVSSSLKRRDIRSDDVVLWDEEKISRFMDAARQGTPASLAGR